MRTEKRGTRAGVAGAALASVVLAGCATPVPERPRGAFVGNQGGASELVFPGPGVVDRLEAAPGWEVSRRDRALSARPPAPVSALTEWPARPRPSLEHTRRLLLRNRADTILYFERHHHPHFDRRRFR